MFGSDYFHAFDAANKRAAVAHERRSSPTRSKVPDNARRVSMASSEAFPTKCPKSHSVAFPLVYLGHQAKPEEKSGNPLSASESNPKLEAALARYERGFRQSRAIQNP
jgi:hypothetical protein